MAVHSSLLLPPPPPAASMQRPRLALPVYYTRAGMADSKQLPTRTFAGPPNSISSHGTSAASSAD